MFSSDPDKLLEHIRSSPSIRAVDDGFLDQAKKALAASGYTALGFLAAHPGCSVLQLAKLLDRGTNAIGLTIALYREAETNGLLRDTAKRLLIGKIREEFPEGWVRNDELGSSVKLGGWRSTIKRHVTDPRYGKYATEIIRDLEFDHPPGEGWKPALENDPLVDELFDRFWPVGKEERSHSEEVTAIEVRPPQQQFSWFDHKSMLMERSLGKEHDKVMHALLPYSLGGALDLYYYPNGIPGTAIATKELSLAPNEGSSNDVYRCYELVMFTKHRLNLDEIKDEGTDFGRAHAVIRAILNDVAPYSAEAKLNPNETGEAATDIDRLGGGCVVFDGFATHSDDVVERFGLLAMIRIFRSEMNYARSVGGAKLLELLKASGHYPYSDLDRGPVV